MVTYWACVGTTLSMVDIVPRHREGAHDVAVAVNDILRYGSGVQAVYDGVSARNPLSCCHQDGKAEDQHDSASENVLNTA